MRIAYTGSQQNAIRNAYANRRWHLVVHRPRTLFAVTLSEIPTNPGEVKYDSVVFGTAPLRDDLTMLIGTSVGDSSKGIVRARRFEFSDTIKIAETATSTIDWQVGDILTVIEDHRPLARHIRYDNSGTGFIDYDGAVGEQTTELVPQPVMGPPAVGWVGETLKFVGDRSRTWVDGATITSVQWRFPDGTVSGSLGTEIAPVEWTPATAYPEGRYVYLNVTDSNGQSRYGARLVFVFDRNDPTKQPPKHVSFNPIRGDVQSGGYEAGVTIWDEMIWSDRTGTLGRLEPQYYPGGTQCVIFEEADWSQADVGALGGGNWKYRENILFWGWVLSERLRPAPANGGRPALEWQLGTIHKVLERIGSYPVALEDSDAPDSWLKMIDPTADRVLHHMAWHRSTVGMITDFFGAGSYGASEVARFYDLPAGSLWSQFRAIYASGSFDPLAIIGCDMQGGIYADLDANVLAQSERAAYPQVAALTEQDRRAALEISQEWTSPVAQVILWGVDYDTAVGARAPDDPMGPGAEVREIPRMIAPSQEVFNAWSGNLIKKWNANIQEIKIPIRGYRLDCFPQSRALLTLDSANLGQRLDLNGATGWIRGFEMNPPQNGTVLSAVTVELDIGNARPGVPIDVPTTPPPAPPPTPPPGPPAPPTPPAPSGGWRPEGWVLTDQHLYYWRNLQAPPSIIQPDIELGDGTPPVALPPKDFAVDPFEPDYYQYAIFPDSSTNVYYRRGADGGNVWERDWLVLCNLVNVFTEAKKTNPAFNNLSPFSIKAIRLDANQFGWMSILVAAGITPPVETRIILVQIKFGKDAGNSLRIEDYETDTEAEILQQSGVSTRGLYLALGAFNIEKVGYGQAVGSWSNRLFPATLIDSGPRYVNQWANNYGSEFFMPSPLTITTPAGWIGQQIQAGVMFDVNDARQYAIWHNGANVSEFQGWFYDPDTTLFVPMPEAPSNAMRADSPPTTERGIATAHLGLVMAYSLNPGERAQKIRFFAGKNNHVWKSETGIYGPWTEMVPTGDVGENITLPTDTNNGYWGMTIDHSAPDKLYGGRIRYAQTGDTVFAISDGGSVWYDRSGAAARIQGNVRLIIPAWWK